MGVRVSVLCVVLAGCESATVPAAFSITSVDPSTWTVGRFRESVTILGTGLFLDVRTDFEKELAADAEYSGTLGEVSLPRVTWQSNSALSAQPPAELAEGVYDLTIRSRDGKSATLRDAVQVVPFSGELFSWSNMGDSVPVDEAVETSASGGGISNSPQSAAMPALHLEVDNHPIVAWSENVAGDAYIYVTRHDGNGWRELGGSLAGTGVSGAGEARWPALAMRSDGHLLLAYQHRGAGLWEIHVQRYTGTWQPYEMTAQSTVVSGGERPTLTWDEEDQRPVAAWQEADGVHAATFVGSAWVGLDGGGTHVAGSNGGENPALASGGTDVYLAFDSPGTGGARQIRVARWAGAAWVGVGGSLGSDGIGATPGDSTFATLAVQGSGDPVVAWQDDSLSGGSEIFARRRIGGAWQAVADSLPQSFAQTTGGISNTAGDSLHPSLTSVGDTLTVVWAQGTRVLAREFSDTYQTTWVAPQGLLDSVVFSGTETVDTPRVAVNPHGRPTVVWSSGDPGATQIYLARRSCQLVWEELVAGATGAVSQTRGCAEAPSLALYSDLAPVVAWHQSAVPYDPGVDAWHIYLRQLSDGDWEERGGSASGAGLSSMTNNGAGFPSLVVDDDEPWVAYSQWLGGWRWEIFLRHLDSGSWDGVDGSGDDPGLSDQIQPSLYPSLAFDPGGEPMVAWQQYVAAGANDLAVAYHRPGSWSSLGNPSSASFPWSPDLAVDGSGDPVVAWHEVSGSTWTVHVARWNTSWAGMGGGGTRVNRGSGRAGPAELVLNDRDEPIVAWQDTTNGNREIYLAAWSTNAGDWVERSGSWSDGGVSQSAGESVEPSLVLDHEQNPVVAWADNATGNWEIFVHRHTASGWAPIADAANVSNTRGSSRQPSLALRDRRLCVAWTESGLYGAEIAVRCVDL